MKKAIYPGSFDPVTLGHLDVIRRASQLFDHLVIAVLHNSAKTPLFSVEERVKMLEEATKDIPNVEVKAFGGLTVEFARECGANALVRGLRAITDFEYEPWHFRYVGKEAARFIMDEGITLEEFVKLYFQ